ncbi:MAG: CPBP family intramembrane metalloprotease [Chloroflexi bacterium]|nr:CPBP family intramembrane metalloprotease [Chloroflexota bacterium]
MTISQSSERPLVERVFLEPQERRLRTGWRIGIHGLALFVAIFLFSIPAGLAQLVGAPEIVVLATGQGAFVLAVTVTVFLARRFLDRRTILSLGFARLNAVKDAVAGFVIAGLIMGAIFVIEWALGWLRVESMAWTTESLFTVIIQLFVWLLIFLAGAWTEELLCRGYWLQNIAEGRGLVWGVIVSSVLFGLLHGLNPNVTVTAIALLVLAGVFLAVPYLYTRQLWMSIGLHLGWNYFEGNIFGFQVSGLDTFRLIRSTVSGPELITGGAFGPEAGLIVLVAMALGTLLIYFYTRGRH